MVLSLFAVISLAVPDTDGDGFPDNNDNCRAEPNGGAPGTLLEGETSTFMADGFSYDVTLTFVDSDEAKFTINAEATPRLHVGESYILSDTSQIKITNILYEDVAGGVHSASFKVGAQRDTDDDGIGDACENMNRPPVLTPIGNRPVAGQTLTVGQTITFTVSASDEDGNSLTFGASMVGGSALLSGMSFENRIFNWTPLASQVGSHPVIFTVTDGQDQDSETVTITVASAQSTEEQRYQALVDEFNDLEDDYSLTKRRYERAVDDDDERDIDDYAEQLEDIDDDLADLEDDAEDLLEDVEDSNLSNRRELADDVEDVQDDIERVRDRIDTLLNGEDNAAAGTTVSTYTPPAPRVEPQPERTRVVIGTLDFPGGNVPNTMEEPTENWPETRKMVLVGAGIVVLIAVIIFLIALMMV